MRKPTDWTHCIGFSRALRSLASRRISPGRERRAEREARVLPTRGTMSPVADSPALRTDDTPAKAKCRPWHGAQSLPHVAPGSANHNETVGRQQKSRASGLENLPPSACPPPAPHRRSHTIIAPIEAKDARAWSVSGACRGPGRRVPPPLFHYPADARNPDCF